MKTKTEQNQLPREIQQPREIQKQISMFIPLSQWKAIRLEAAKQKIPITELCRRWMKPGLQKLLSSEQN